MKLPEVISMGNLLVKVMRPNLAETLPQSGIFTGPFPCGNTVINIHWQHAAAGPLNPTDIQAEYFATAKWLRLTGAGQWKATLPARKRLTLSKGMALVKVQFWKEVRVC